MNLASPTEDHIEDLIYHVRGQKVMLDADLAELYGVETKRLKEQVRRNKNRFPEDFMFELTKEEWESLRSQIATIESQGRGKHSKYPPFAFTEQGVSMLSSVLNSPRAIEVNISIIRVFVKMRQLLQAIPQEILERLERLEKNEILQNKHILDIYEMLQRLTSHKKEKPPQIGFKQKEK